MNNSSYYNIALSLIPNVGPILARKLVAYIGSVEGIFKENKAALEKVPGIGPNIINAICRGSILAKAEKELQYNTENNIKHIFYLDKEYPVRLKECEDAPINVFYKGANYFNSEKLISIVGTRRSTHYGEEVCEKLVEELSILFPELVIVSGFAYGVDICAHKSAMHNNLPTIGVFGHGVDQIYPAVHRKYVNRVLEKGALVSEFSALKKPDPGNFVSRNRIIAGLADATIVVESGLKGGSLLTADMALSYNREVFAFPGRVGDPYSKGCNNLIKKNTAALIESASDLIYYMKWDPKEKAKPTQKSLFVNLLPEEEIVVNCLKGADSIFIDELSRKSGFPAPKLSSILLKLEFDGIIGSLPGKKYKLK